MKEQDFHPSIDAQVKFFEILNEDPHPTAQETLDIVDQLRSAGIYVVDFKDMATYPQLCYMPGTHQNFLGVIMWMTYDPYVIMNKLKERYLRLRIWRG